MFFLFNFDHDLVQVQLFRGLIANADDLSTKDWQLYLDGQKIEFGINPQDDGWQTLQHQDDVLSNMWNYVKVLRKNGVIKIGLNGVESSNAINAGTQSVSNLASFFVLGGMYRYSPYNGFIPNGYIDELLEIITEDRLGIYKSVLNGEFDIKKGDEWSENIRKRSMVVKNIEIFEKVIPLFISMTKMYSVEDVKDIFYFCKKGNLYNFAAIKRIRDRDGRWIGVNTTQSDIVCQVG